ncbi:caspase domain-domain-containing protein [Kockovaella imperatae]|uniref:Caspase domain-domain-containing protein n=1 Tax=Kockovaella imperatae TaxID=4999 RepID=A0A1Y1UNK3_9TREE|nr:caspase domain-domain-containing protein [Kockovaella imperatae]ORX39623.1 caspase domain-domain-containing protein [Kockovaella imperatae]
MDDRYQYQDQQGYEPYAPPLGPPPPPPQQQHYYGGYQGYDNQGYAPPPGPPPTQREVYQQQDAQGHVAEQSFEYSRCNGKKKALLIGINYFGSDAELGGCINDVYNVHAFICGRFGYDPADCVILTDDKQDPRSYPTKDNIIRAMAWLVDGAQRDDALFFHYSGHGTQVEDVDGDEHDDDDEAICPVDFQQAGLIIDDDSAHDLLVKPLPAGCRLTAIFDSCHSGTVMDLPYAYTVEGNIKKPNLFEGTQSHLLDAGMGVLTGNTGNLFSGLFRAAQEAFENHQSQEMTVKTKTSPADVIQWAGCKDSQTSADTQEAGKATGAMSYAFIASLSKYPDQSYQQLLETVREEMKGKYSQVPQLSACHPIDTSLQFVA